MRFLPHCLTGYLIFIYTFISIFLLSSKIYTHLTTGLPKEELQIANCTGVACVVLSLGLWILKRMVIDRLCIKMARDEYVDRARMIPVALACIFLLSVVARIYGFFMTDTIFNSIGLPMLLNSLIFSFYFIFAFLPDTRSHLRFGTAYLRFSNTIAVIILYHIVIAYITIEKFAKTHVHGQIALAILCTTCHVDLFLMKFRESDWQFNDGVRGAMNRKRASGKEQEEKKKQKITVPEEEDVKISVVETRSVKSFRSISSQEEQ